MRCIRAISLSDFQLTTGIHRTVGLLSLLSLLLARANEMSHGENGFND